MKPNSFTLIELVIVIAIASILATVVVLTINPAEQVKSARDSTRMSDLQTIHSSIGLYQADGGTNIGSANTVYVSIPDSSASCANLGLPTLPSGWSYACSTSVNYQKTNGTGWVPIPFSSISFGNVISSLPVDPINTTSTGNYYTYVTGGSWKLAAMFESSKYAVNMSKDGGPDPGLYEFGSDLSLAPFQRGLVGYWKFDEGSGTLYDSSGNANHGTQSGGVTYGVAGKVGTALNFIDGTYVNIPSAAGSILDITGNITVSVWFKKSAGHVPNLIGKGTNNNYSYRLMATNYYVPGVGAGITWGTNISYAWGQASWSCGVSYSTCPNDWTYAVGTFDSISNTLKLYINGVLVSTASGGGNPVSNAYPVEISLGRYDGSLWWLTGQIDDVRVYNRALSAAEISAIYNATR